MSIASDRGRNTEREVAALLRKKLGAKVERDRRSGAGVNKADISDYFRELPLFIECKDQETLKVKEWMRETTDKAVFTQIPTLVFRMENDLVACLPFPELVNLLVEMADLRAEIADLRKPIIIAEAKEEKVTGFFKGARQSASTQSAYIPMIDVARTIQYCREGHIADRYGYCQQKGCKYSRGYRKPKAKKAAK